jgi:glycosyltransferase involved in cell wall biosynthesis
MACGTPVITSKASSLPEVVGQAGVLVDPTDTEALAVAMEQLLKDVTRQAKMRAAGLERAKNFSWRETARCTTHSYRQALASEGGEGRV